MNRREAFSSLAGAVGGVLAGKDVLATEKVKEKPVEGNNNSLESRFPVGSYVRQIDTKVDGKERRDRRGNILTLDGMEVVGHSKGKVLCKTIRHIVYDENDFYKYSYSSPYPSLVSEDPENLTSDYWEGAALDIKRNIEDVKSILVLLKDDASLPEIRMSDDLPIHSVGRNQEQLKKLKSVLVEIYEDFQGRLEKELIEKEKYIKTVRV